MEDQDLTIHTNESGNEVFPMEAGQLKKGDHIVIRDRPCKIVDMTKSKTGKHGSAKCSIVGLDIFTAKKMEDSCPSSQTAMCPRVSKNEYLIADVNDGQVHCITDDGTEIQFVVPAGELGDKLTKRFDNGDALVATVISAMGEQHIMDIKEER